MNSQQCEALCVVHMGVTGHRERFQRGKQCREPAIRQLHGRWFCWTHAATVLQPMARSDKGEPLRVVKRPRELAK
jgi:hypothetical protein